MKTLKEAAVFTGFTPSYLYKLTSTGRIPHYKPTGGKLFFKETELEAFLTRNRITPNYELENQAQAFLQGGKK